MHIFLALQYIVILLGCNDDTGGMQYSIGQEFMTSNSCHCLCGNGGNISCDFSNCGPSESGT